MNDNKPTADDTVRMEKVVEKDATTKVQKDTKWIMLKELVRKCISTCTKKVRKYTTICVKKIGKYTIIYAKSVVKYIIICTKKVDECTYACTNKISETKFAVIMNAKDSEVYGEVRKAIMKITCKLAHKNETKRVKAVEQLKRLDASVTTIKANTISIKKINAYFVLFCKKTFVLVKCVALLTLNATTTLGILVVRVVYYTAREIIYAVKEIVLTIKDI